MNENLSIIGIVIAYGVSFILLFTRMHKWNTDKLRLVVTSILLIVSLVGLPIDGLERDINFLHFCLKCPFIYCCMDILFKAISKSVYNRDFYVWLRGSDDIGPSIFDKNPHVKPLDKLFSVLLSFTIMFLPLFGM